MSDYMKLSKRKLSLTWSYSHEPVSDYQFQELVHLECLWLWMKCCQHPLSSFSWHRSYIQGWGMEGSYHLVKCKHSNLNFQVSESLLLTQLVNNVTPSSACWIHACNTFGIWCTTEVMILVETSSCTKSNCGISWPPHSITLVHEKCIWLLSVGDDYSLVSICL